MDYKDIYKLQKIGSLKAKGKYIEENKEDEYLVNILYYALNPLLTYNISEKSLEHLLDEEIISGENYTMFANIFDCCESLSRMRGMDGATLRQVEELLLHYNKEERELYIKLLSKRLRLGITGKTINKYISGLIPEWEVQQAYTVEKHNLNADEEFWLTEKLNGVRATFYKGNLISRSGVEYTGMDHIIKEISWLNNAGFVADGELILKNKNGLSDNEAFRKATGIINSDDEYKTSICYTIFDIIPHKEFERCEFVSKYSVRREMMNKLSDELKRNKSSSVRVLPVLYYGKDKTKIKELLNKMVDEDKEGLMINRNVPYQRKRHNGILKVKRFYTMDLPIIRCEEGSGRFKGSLGALVVDYKGNEVNVGSGFSDDERDMLWKNKDIITGSLCEVKYKEISQDKKTNKYSLQFPVFLRIRKDKTEISYD